jgi:hypothetical protein
MDRKGAGRMPAAKVKAVYYKLVILASSAATEIWLGDDAGHLVQKEIGEMRTSLLAGEYVVAFGLGTSTYPIHLKSDSRHTQAELAAGPTCLRPGV